MVRARRYRNLSGTAIIGHWTAGTPIPSDQLGAIAQLGECLDRTQEVAGSSPASSIRPVFPGLYGKLGRLSFSATCSSAQSSA